MFKSSIYKSYILYISYIYISVILYTGLIFLYLTRLSSSSWLEEQMFLTILLLYYSNKNIDLWFSKCDFLVWDICTSYKIKLSIRGWIILHVLKQHVVIDWKTINWAVSRVKMWIGLWSIISIAFCLILLVAFIYWEAAELLVVYIPSTKESMIDSACFVYYTSQKLKRPGA